MLIQFAVTLLLFKTATAATSSAKQCYGPDYTEEAPFIGIPYDLCTHAYYNSSSTRSLEITLSYGDTVFGQETISDRDPSFDEKTICDPEFPAPFELLHSCSLCLGFDDILLSDKWAKICPKYIFKCRNPMGQSIRKEVPEPCFTVGSDDSDDIAQIVGGNTDFALKLLSSNALTQDIVTDLFVSPFSITNALLMPMMAANGETLRQLMAAFELTNDDYAIFDSFDTLIQALQHKTTGLVDIIDNKLWINSVWFKTVSPNFLKDFDRFGTIQSCNFKNASYIETRKIDTDVEELTRNLIKQPLANRNLSSNTIMLLTNTMYFKGKWKYPFTDTIVQTFTDDNNQEEIKIEMMQNKVTLNKYVDSDVEVIELPFEDDFSYISFIMIRPTQQKYLINGASSTIEFEKLLNRTLLKKWLHGLSETTQAENLSLPFLEMYNMQDITSSLQAIGIVDVFDPEKADLKNLTTPHYQVFETNLNRQDYMKITQNGIEIASLVTDGDDGKDDTNQGAVQHADLPFLFFIMDRSVDLILYAGRVTNPKGWMIYKPSNTTPTTGKSHSSILKIMFWMFVIIICSYFVIKYGYNVTVMNMSKIEAIPHINQCISCKNKCGNVYRRLYRGDISPPSPHERYEQLVSDHMAL